MDETKALLPATRSWRFISWISFAALKHMRKLKFRETHRRCTSQSAAELSSEASRIPFPGSSVRLRHRRRRSYSRAEEDVYVLMERDGRLRKPALKEENCSLLLIL